MNRFLGAALVLAVLLTLAAAGSGMRGETAEDSSGFAKNFSPGYRVVFLSVLEGCFQDGLSDADVDQILRNPRPEQDWYEHFIQNCPVCMATIQALQTYRARPDARMKQPGKVSFGGGLSPEMHARLYSDDLKTRLSAIHDLEQAWVERHVASLRLNPEELARTREDLKEARKVGIEIMQMFSRSSGLSHIAPAYQAGDECAVCNAANGMALKLAPRP